MMPGNLGEFKTEVYVSVKTKWYKKLFYILTFQFKKISKWERLGFIGNMETKTIKDKLQ